MVIYLWRGVRAEFLKIKRSQVLFVALLIPLFPAGLNFGEVLQRGLHVLESDTPGRLSPWSMYFRSSIDYWTIFALPLVVAVLSTLLANVDHQNHQWKELFSLAFPRTGVFAGKWTALMALCALSSIAFGIANILGGLAAGFLRPDLGLSLATLPWIEAFSRPLLGWLLSSSMITIQLWISLHWSQFLVSILSGFLEVVVNLFVVGSFMAVVAGYVPWSMPSNTYTDGWPFTLMLSLFYTILVYLLANAEFIHRDVF
jgi:hypothetical protein